MVDVRVRQQHEVQLLRGDGDGLVLEQIAPLLHAVVHQTLFVADLEIGAAPRDLVGRAEKCHFHGFSLRILFFLYSTPSDRPQAR